MPERPAADDPDQPRFAWAPGSTGTGPMPTAGLDYQALLEALAAGGFLDGKEEDQNAVAAEEQAAVADGRMSAPPLPPATLGALAAEHMAPGAAQAGWLAAAATASGRLDEYGLAGVAIAARQLASWAQAAELAAVAQLAARAAAADPEIGLRGDGRPARLCRDALGQISLALMLTDHAATDWASLGISLTWRLPATGAALAGGRIDLARAKVIAEATSVLSQDAARAVEATILPGAGKQTTAQLRARLRRAVLAADPEGAEQRREEAERYATVSLYSDEDGTATLTGAGLPAVEAAAAMARITAIARAMKAAGQAGGLNLHRAKVMLGLLLGTLPYIPPPGGTPEPPPPGGPGPGGPAPDGGPPGDHPRSHPGSGGDPGACPDTGPPGGRPDPHDEDAPADDGPDEQTPGDDAGGSGYAGGDDDRPGAGPVPPWPALGVIPPGLLHTAPPAGGRPPGAGLLDLTLPWATLAGHSSGPGILSRIGPITATQARHLARTAQADPAAQWRIIITSNTGQAITITRITRIPRRRARDRPGPARDRPGPARDRPGPARDGPGAPEHRPPPGTGLAGRITLTITQDILRQHTGPGSPAGPGPPGGIAGAALAAAAKALDQALAQADADAAAGGCAHTTQSPGYRPPPRLREHVTARDVTCRNPACRQPAWRADLDHTIPYDHGGPTCRCNLGGACRRDHQLKQHPRWKLEQTRPGEFTWTTPSGRTYTASPDTYPL